VEITVDSRRAAPRRKVLRQETTKWWWWWWWRPMSTIRRDSTLYISMPNIGI